MKRFLALVMALCLLFPAALAENVQSGTTAEREGNACGVTIWRNHQETETDLQQIVLDYPTFECDDAAFQQLLNEQVSEPIRELGMLEAGAVRGGFYASLDFEGVLSVETEGGDDLQQVKRLAADSFAFLKEWEG